MIYSKCGKYKENVKKIYLKFCEDETPLIKKAAVMEFGQVCMLMDIDIITMDMIYYYKKFMADSVNMLC